MAILLNLVKHQMDACSVSQPMCWTRSRTALPRKPNNARAILPDTNTVSLDLLCVTTARRDFMVVLSSFYSFNNSYF